MNCIVHAHNAGLFSLINNVITCLDRYENVQVDWSDTLYSIDKKDLWIHLFDPLPKVSQPFVDLHGYEEDQWLTYKNAGLLYQGDDAWRQRCNEHLNRLRINHWIVEQADNFIIKNFGDEGYISMLVRAHGHAGEQLTDRSQTLDEYAKEIEAINVPERDAFHRKIFLMCGDLESVEWFKSRFDIVVHPETKRMDTRGTDRHLVVPQTPLDAQLALQEALILQGGSHLIHPVSNIATFALYANPSITSMFIP